MSPEIPWIEVIVENDRDTLRLLRHTLASTRFETSSHTASAALQDFLVGVQAFDLVNGSASVSVSIDRPVPHHHHLPQATPGWGWRLGVRNADALID